MATTTVKAYEAGKLRVHTGTTDVDVSAATYTNYTELLAIAPKTGFSCQDMRLKLDLHKATTGFAAVNSSETAIFIVGTAVDGTNYRLAKNTETPSSAISGTNAASGAVDIFIGDVDAAHPVKVYIKLSAETGGDCEFPYVLTYKSGAEATVTEVAAG